MGWPSPEIISAYADLCRAFQWPIVALVLSLIFKDQIRTILLRVRRGKLFGQEFDLSEVLHSAKEDVDASARDASNSSTAPTDDDAESSERTTDAIIRQILEVSSLSPRAGVMLVGAEIEQFVRWLATSAGYEVRPYASIREIGRVMVNQGRITQSTLRSLESFWKIRNRIVHDFAGEDRENLAAVDIGISLLRQIRQL